VSVYVWRCETGTDDDGGGCHCRGSRTKLLIQDDELMLINFPISCRRSTTHHTMLFHDFIIDHTTRQPPHFVRRDSSGPPTPCTFFLFFLICSCFFLKKIFVSSSIEKIYSSLGCFHACTHQNICNN
jgi:hypothetical protein